MTAIAYDSSSTPSSNWQDNEPVAGADKAENVQPANPTMRAGLLALYY